MSASDLAIRWADRRVTIAGGAGFIGSTLALTLSAAGARVTVLDNFGPLGGANRQNLAGLNAEARIIQADVRDEAALKTLADADVLFNLAAQTSHKDSMDDPLTDLDINTRAALGLLEACRRAARGPRIVFASTRQVYGRPDYLPVDENHPARPPDVNGVNKLAAEQHHLLYHRVHGIGANVARLTNTYGPRMRIKDARQMFLGAWIGAALSGERFEVWGGAQKRDLSFVDDAVDALIAIAEAPPGQIFNIGGGAPVTLLDLAALVHELAGGPGFAVKDFPAARQAIDIGDYYADDTALRRATGWAPRTALREGLARTIAYYRAHLSDYR